MKYYIKMAIGGELFVWHSDASIRDLWYTATTVVRSGKRNKYKARFTVKSLHNGELLFSVYSWKTVNGNWYSNLSPLGKYGLHRPKMFI